MVFFTAKINERKNIDLRMQFEWFWNVNISEKDVKFAKILRKQNMY